MKMIPTYALYGEADSDRMHDWLHSESIQSRSRMHHYVIAPHRHERFFQVLHLTGGSARVTLDGEIYDVRPPAVVVVPAMTVHGYAFSEDVEGVVVTLVESDLAAEGLDIPSAGVVKAEIQGPCDALYRLIAEADRPDRGHNLAMRAHITLLMVALHRASHEPAEAGERWQRARVHAKAFRELVDQRFRQTRRIADYAGALGMSQTHLNRVCRQVYGTSALSVIEGRIAIEARRQLLFSSLSIKQIGAELGYDDPAYFTRFVTRVLGVAPARFRQRARART